MMSQNRLDQRIGILGGGQLGCMLADAAISLGLHPAIYAESSSPAAALFAEQVSLGEMRDTARLREFLTNQDVVVFENEFLDCTLLEEAARGSHVRFAPGLSAIRRLQDKLSQKKLLEELGLPSAPFTEILPGQEARAAVDAAYGRFGGQVVFKWSRMGYDGKGVCLARDTAEGRLEAERFCRESLDRRVPVYAERKIAFRRELAIIACRDGHDGALSCYPLVISEQERGICRRVLGPATALGVSPGLEAEAVAAARRLGEAVRLEGAFALELFETEDGRLSINEIAPRVHNSGHYSQDACRASQFENHWRAVLGLGLRAPDPAPAFGMLNLLGPERVAVALPRRREELPFAPAPAPLKLHWYAKAEIRPWRKVGHVNAVADDPNRLPELERSLQNYHSAWAQSLPRLPSQRSPS
jgi:5-(carboxyamino)imidazole ribonucleotide synthase